MPRRRRQAPPDRSGPQVAVGYLRRSTDRQEQSIPDQRTRLQFGKEVEQEPLPEIEDEELEIVVIHPPGAMEATEAAPKPPDWKQVAGVVRNW